MYYAQCCAESACQKESLLKWAFSMTEEEQKMQKKNKNCITVESLEESSNNNLPDMQDNKEKGMESRMRAQIKKTTMQLVVEALIALAGEI